MLRASLLIACPQPAPCRIRTASGQRRAARSSTWLHRKMRAAAVSLHVLDALGQHPLSTGRTFDHGSQEHVASSTDTRSASGQGPSEMGGRLVDPRPIRLQVAVFLSAADASPHAALLHRTKSPVDTTPESPLGSSWKRYRPRSGIVAQKQHWADLFERASVRESAVRSARCAACERLCHSGRLCYLADHQPGRGSQWTISNTK